MVLLMEILKFSRQKVDIMAASGEAIAKAIKVKTEREKQRKINAAEGT